MNKKTKIGLTTFLVAVPLCVSCCVLAATNSLSFSRANRALAVDSWYEKAYEAPTGSDVGYKHYYLGCPGNARTSDAEHNVEVSLEDITIPALTVIDRDTVAPGSEISNIVDAKIKHCDQATTYSADGGTPVFVEDQGRQALFFSRSGNLGEGEVVGDTNYTEFRFEKNFSKLTAVTFEYRYLDYNTWAPEGAQHIRTEVKSNGAYLNHDFAFINDDAWHTGTIYYDELSITHLLFIVSDFQGHLFISNIEYHGFDELGLDPVSGYDAINPTTVTDLGIENGALVPDSSTSQHIFKPYDFAANKGIDFWFTPSYTIHSDDAFAMIYLFCDTNGAYVEDGIIFRYNFTRAEDDGILFTYVYTMRDYGAGSTVVTGAGNPGTAFAFPRVSGVKSTANVRMHVFAYCIDEATNTYRCGFTAGVAGMGQYNLSTNPEDQSNTPMTFDIVLGANYFDNGAHRYLRISSRADDHRIYDAYSEEQVVVYKDADGNVMGKKNTNTINLIEYGQANKTLVGWFNHKGERVTDGQYNAAKNVIQPLLVNTQQNMIVPSDLMMMEKGEWMNRYTNSPAETASEGYVSTSNRVDLYFIYQPTEITGSDNWSKFGFPYDMIDAKSRITIRINENNSGALDGYIFGGSLGGEGAEGTYFTSGAGFRVFSDYILIHLVVIDGGANDIVFGFEAINLRTRASITIQKDVTFTEYSIYTDYRNKMCAMKTVGCACRFMDAF